MRIWFQANAGCSTGLRSNGWVPVGAVLVRVPVSFTRETRIISSCLCWMPNFRLPISKTAAIAGGAWCHSFHAC